MKLLTRIIFAIGFAILLIQVLVGVHKIGPVNFGNKGMIGLIIGAGILYILIFERKKKYK